MKKYNRLNPLYPVLGTAVLALMSACAAQPAKQEAAVVETPASQCEYEPWDGDILEMPLDGSSLEAFDCSVERFNAQATAEEQSGLKGAIDYLLIYDIGAKGDRATLASRVDGATASELMSRVRWRKPDSKTSPAVRNAADAKIEG